MSRIFVKDLPAKVSEADLKKHFSQKGNVTDVKLVFKNGEFRRYAFIGFEKEEDADNACKYFDNTFIKQAKISVELWKNFKSDANHLSWREKNKLRKQQEKDDGNINTNDARKAENKKNASKNNQIAANLLETYKDDPDFVEFMKSKGEELANEDPSKKLPMQVAGSTEGEDEEDQDDGDDDDDDSESEVKVADKKDVSDLDYLKSLMVSSKSDKSTDTTKKKPVLLKKYHQVVIRTKERCKVRQKGTITFTYQSIKQFLHPLKIRRLRIPPETKYVAYVGFKTEREMQKALEKDRSFINGARVHVVKYEDAMKKDDDSPSTNAQWQLNGEKLKDAEPVMESGRLYVRNLWYSVTEEHLRELFEKYGQVTDITLPLCKITRRCKGYAMITFMFPEHSVRAMNELNGEVFLGRILHILPCLAKENEREVEGSYKEKKAKELKATAGSWHNWNSLFLGSGAVIDVMAQKYNKSKQEILNAEGKQSVAVNLALGESQIVDETRRFLEEHGIAVDAFTEPGVQRSSTVILVKNLPANTTAQELSEVFSRHGELGRVVLPPAGVTGIVEYLDPGEAKKGFRSLAYSRFQYLPLYLEWAPQRVFKTAFTPKPQKNAKVEVPYGGNKGNYGHETSDETEGEQQQKQEQQQESQQQRSKVKKELPDPEPETTIHVKNLNFHTTETELQEHFKKIGPVHTALISKRRGLSQGYGFVQFVYQAHAQMALREMQETLLDDYHIQLKLSEKTLVNTVQSARMMHSVGKQNSKILVKNIPFEATRKEVRQLFSTFGEIKCVRVPTKPNSDDHRGFGFVEFISKEEAKKAFDALCHSTHLYGRRLVLEWAKDEDSVDEIRKRTAEKFLSGETPLKKKRLAETLDSGMEVDD